MRAFIFCFVSMTLLLGSGSRAEELRKAPAFNLTDLQGRVWTEKGRGEGLLLVDFWASWCTPCIKEIPTLNALHLKYGPSRKMEVLGVNLDMAPEKAKASSSKYYIAYPVVRGNEALASAFAFEGFPAAFLLKDGYILKVFQGERNLASFERDLKPFLRNLK